VAFYDTSDAIYGVGVYGLASYGVVTPVVQLTGVSATTALEPVSAGGFEIDITERIDSGVEGTGQVGSPAQIKVGAGATGVEAAGSIGILEHSNTILLQSVVGTVAEPSVEPQITEVIGGVSAIGQVNGAFTHSNTHVITSVGMTGTAGQTTETGVLFDFEAVKSLYDRKRTIYIGRAA